MRYGKLRTTITFPDGSIDQLSPSYASMESRLLSLDPWPRVFGCRGISTQLKLGEVKRILTIVGGQS